MNESTDEQYNYIESRMKMDQGVSSQLFSGILLTLVFCCSSAQTFNDSSLISVNDTLESINISITTLPQEDRNASTTSETTTWVVPATLKPAKPAEYRG